MYNFLVSISCESPNGAFYVYKEPVDTLVNATRIVLTFKPRRNYVAYSYVIGDYNALV